MGILNPSPYALDSTESFLRSHPLSFARMSEDKVLAIASKPRGGCPPSTQTSNGTLSLSATVIANSPCGVWIISLTHPPAPDGKLGLDGQRNEARGGVMFTSVRTR